MTQQTELETDLLVIGWGKAGKTLARGQALAGRKVVLVEVDQQMVGGTCINVACVPTKALVHRAANRANRPADDYFRDSLNFRDQLTSKLSVKRLGRSSMQMQVHICGPDDAVRVEGRLTVVFADLEKISSVSIPEDIRALIEPYLDAEEA